MIDPASLSPWHFLAAPPAVAPAYVVFGLTGFGSTHDHGADTAHFLPV